VTRTCLAGGGSLVDVGSVLAVSRRSRPPTTAVTRGLSGGETIWRQIVDGLGDVPVTNVRRSTNTTSLGRSCRRTQFHTRTLLSQTDRRVKELWQMEVRIPYMRNGS